MSPEGSCHVAWRTARVLCQVSASVTALLESPAWVTWGCASAGSWLLFLPWVQTTTRSLPAAWSPRPLPCSPPSIPAARVPSRAEPLLHCQQPQGSPGPPAPSAHPCSLSEPPQLSFPLSPCPLSPPDSWGRSGCHLSG